MTGVPPFSLDVEIKHSGSSKSDFISLPHIPTTTYSLRIPHKYLREGHSSVSIKHVRDGRGCQSKPSTPQLRPKVQISVHDPPTITALEAQDNYCVGEYLSFRLSGSPAFEVFYSFGGKPRKAREVSTLFKRIADQPGIFSIDAISDAASECKAAVSNVKKIIHPKPRGSVSKGKYAVVDIHEGGETELVFDFVGTPPFEFSYTRSTELKKGEKQVILETKTERTTERNVVRKVSSEGEYELISVKDAYCLSSKQRTSDGRKGQKMLTN